MESFKKFMQYVLKVARCRRQGSRPSSPVILSGLIAVRALATIYGALVKRPWFYVAGIVMPDCWQVYVSISEYMINCTLKNVFQKLCLVNIKRLSSKTLDGITEELRESLSEFIAFQKFEMLEKLAIKLN